MEQHAKRAEPPPACGACGEPETPASPHRRGRCRRCYDAWVRERPVGLNALCCACGEKRNPRLRHFELGHVWVVLCHNCAAGAERLGPLPHTVAGLKLKLRRDRRWGDRRAESVGARRKDRGTNERRGGERRHGERILDATHLAVMELEMEAEPGTPMEDMDPADGPITGVHRLIEPADL
jgi:hypothetical protein